MASSVGMWALVVLSFLATSCISQDVYPDRYAVLYSSSSQLEYKTDKTGDQNVEKNEEVSVVGLGDKSSSTKGDEGMLVPNEKLLEVMEQPAIRKKAACVGCPTDIDVGIPNNREALLEMLRVSLPATDVESLFKNGPPNIVAAAKLIESGVRYSVTFETAGSPCSMIDEELFSEGCLPQQSLCIADILITIDGTQSAILRNCSSSPQGLAKNWESIENSDPLQDSTMNVEDIVAGDSVLGNEQGIDGTREALHISSVDYPQGIPSEHIRLKRSNDLSGLKDVDKSEWKLISQFAELAVKTLDEVDPDDMKQIILGVTEAKKQIVNGIMYHLVLKVGTSTCQEDAASLADSTCVQNELYPERICRVQIHRSWADESPLNAKVVKSECADVWPDDPLRELPSAERARRSNQDCWPSTDGWKTYDFKDGTQEDCFEKVMTSFQDVLNVKDVAKVATIRDAHTRMNKETMEPEMVVTIILADPEKLKMMGNIKKPMVVSSRVICSQRLKRSLPGGIIPGDVNDPKVINIAKFALPEIQNSINSPYQHSLFRIVDVGYQIVAGSLYHLKLEVAPTSCLKSDKSSEPCTSTDTEQLLICNLKVWDQPWTQKREVQDISCGASRSKREEHVLGGLEHVAADDPYVQELASFAVSEIDKSLNSPYQQKVLRVVEAKTQVVAGTLMYLKLELVTTNCLKSEMAGVGNCTHNPDQTSTMCSVKVWDQPWLKKREVQDVQCGRSRSKRDASSFEEQKFLPVDAKDPYIVEATSYALNELDKSTNTPYHHKILHIISAAIQHTEITKVRLLLNVGYSSCKKSSSGLSGSRDCDLLQGTSQKLCHVELMHEPLLQIRFVTRMDCSNSDQKKVHQHNDHLIGEDSLDAHSAMFREFIHRFNKTYSSDAELQKRFNIFRANLKLIAQLQEGEQGTATYGPTIFADLSPKEFKSRFLGLRPDLHQENAVPMRMADIPNINLPLSFDWRDHNAVTPVKNQGACGSCWAFAVTGNIEGQNAIKHGVLVPLSEQELVDCDTLDDGCKGGLPENAYHALESLGGIESESDYPYDGRDEQCHFNQSDVRVLIKSSVNITTSEHDMAKWLVKNGPIAIGINANAMQFYFGGVSHPFKFLCTPEDLDHGVLIVGYGVHTYPMFKKELPFWTIKNSWGDRWGEQGYYRVYRGDGTCGVNQMASSAVIN